MRALPLPELPAKRTRLLVDDGATRGLGRKRRDSSANLDSNDDITTSSNQYTHANSASSEHPDQNFHRAPFRHLHSHERCDCDSHANGRIGCHDDSDGGTR
jgi:hypothetical protein